MIDWLGLSLYIDSVESSVIGPLEIEDEQVWEREVSIIPTRSGIEQRVEFFLYRTGEEEFSDRVWFWTDVE